MSSFVYGLITSKRAAAEPGESHKSKPPAMGTYIDTVSALVPAEALALYSGVVIPNVTRVTTAYGKTATVISYPRLLGWSCIGLLALSTILYLLGRYESAKLTLWDIPRSLIPPAAFAAWILVERPSVFDIWWAGSSIEERVIITAFAAVLLGILAKVLGYQVDMDTAKQRVQLAAGPAPR